jgi:hypothetical protein
MASPTKFENLVAPQISLTRLPDRVSWLGGLKSVLKSTVASAEALSLWLAAHDDPDLVAKLKPYEKNYAKLRGYLQIGDVGVKTVGYTFFFGYVSGAGPTATNISFAVAVAIYLAAVDHFTFVRGTLVATGLRGMADAGMTVKLPSASHRSAKLAKVLRLTMSGITGVLLAFVIGLTYDHAAIVKQETLDSLSSNHALVEQATRDYDAKAQRAEKEYRDELALLNRNLSARRREALSAEVAHHQAELQEIKANRSSTITRWITSQPDFIPKDDSFFGHIKAFLEMLWENPLAAVPILALDAAALLIDLLTATLSLSYIPSTYAAEMLRRQLQEIVLITRSAAAGLKPAAQGAGDADNVPAAPPAEPDAQHAAPPKPPPPPNPAANGAAPPPKRPRGRPRKQVISATGGSEV